MTLLESRHSVLSESTTLIIPEAALRSPGRAFSVRHRVELATIVVCDQILIECAARVRTMASQVLNAPALLAAAANPFSYTAVLSAWRKAATHLAGLHLDLFPGTIEGILLDAKLPGQMHAEVSDLLLTSRDKGWSEYKTRVELGRLLTPRQTPRTIKGVPRTAVEQARFENYKVAVRRVARTAASANYNSAVLRDLARAPSSSNKTWVAHHDKHTRFTHRVANGQTVPLNDPFQVGNDSLMFPGDPSGSPEEIMNCRCVVVDGSFVIPLPKLLTIAASSAPPSNDSHADQNLLDTVQAMITYAGMKTPR